MKINILKGNNPIPIEVLVLLWIPILFFDSLYFSTHYQDGKPITTVSVISITIYILWNAPLRLKVLMLIMIPLSWLGELMFCDWFDMYDYRGGQIPLYVPFGHAGIFAVGWLLSQKIAVNRNPRIFKIYLIAFYLIAFAFVILFLGDTLSLLFGILFFIVLKRKNFSFFYLIMSLIVLYLELVGTYFGVWKWHQEQGIFQTVNPPLGAIFIYVGGDLVVGRFTRFVLKKRRSILIKARTKYRVKELG